MEPITLPSLVKSDQADVTPSISLDPTLGPVDTITIVSGSGWQPGSTVLIYLESLEEGGTDDYVFGSAMADTTGQFQTKIVIPADPRWNPPRLVRVVAKSGGGKVNAQALFNLSSTTGQTGVLSPTPQAQLGNPLVIATHDANIRRGPGVGYPVLGLLRAGQQAEVTGVSLDGGWWQIKFAGLGDGRGWLAAQFVAAQNIDNIPVVQPPDLPTAIVPQSGQPTVQARTNVNIHSEPSLAYPVLGILRTGQNAEVTGVSTDGAWWQIKCAGAENGLGWLAALYSYSA
jgi:uncharacterized protein YraI